MASTADIEKYIFILEHMHYLKLPYLSGRGSALLQLLERHDAHHVSDDVGGKFKWVDMNHTLFAFLVKTLSGIFDAFSNLRVEFILTDLPPAFQGVAVASHAIFEAGVGIGDVIRTCSSPR
jgi:hypothetical protein